ncbi:amino acid adenylation domain-containing protein, partial [Pseudomonas sp. ES1]
MDLNVASRIAKRFINLPLEKRRLYLEQMAQEGITPANLPIPETRGDFEVLPLSFAQERQWFLWQLDPQGSAYVLPMALRLRGALDLDALAHAFNALIARHEALRTRFIQVDGLPSQQVLPELQLQVGLHEQPGLDEAQAQVAIKAFVQAQVAQPFDLEQGPLLRAEVLRLAAEDHVLVVSQHHIIGDGRSLQIMVAELIALYEGRLAGVEPPLAALPIQYADYAVWQRRWLEAGERERQLDYWTQALGSDHGILELPTDFPRPAEQSLRGARCEIRLPEGLHGALNALARAHDVTLFMLLLASFQTLLHRYSGQARIRVGVPTANRNRVETENLIGFFVNTQILSADFDSAPPFSTLLQQVKASVIAAQAHQELPFEQLVEALQPERSLSHNPLFQVLFNHQRQARNPGAQAQAGGQGLAVESLEWESRNAQLDLSLDTFEGDDGLAASFTYATDLFSAETIARMAGHWVNLLQALVADAAQRVVDLPLLEAAERAQQLQGWNATAVDYPLHSSIRDLIEAQVARTPQAPALVFGEQTLSYAELNARANQLARWLVAQGIGCDGLVGVAMERSLEMVVALLAVIKAGGAYVPLDPDYPEDRLAYMIEDSGIELLLSQPGVVERLPLPEHVRALALAPGATGFDSHSADDLGLTIVPEQLAYVIYTSGSTGKPKGAGNRHSALTNRLCWMQQAYGLGAGDTVLQKTPFSFDVSVWEFFWPLMTGARLAVAGPGDHKDPARLVALINEHQVTTLHFVPSMLQVFLLDEQVASCTSLSRIVCSGEALPVEAQRQVFAKLPTAGLYNLYGPTEAAIDVTHWTCREEGRDSVPIGQPIANLHTYVLDGELEPVPQGVIGELFLGGEGLARGYHRRPGLTAERFMTSPFGDGQRLYRTGDLARYRADGVIEYAGRIDHQVKIRGLRIELGEIEARLMALDEVREAVVLALDLGHGQQLVAYVVAVDGEEGGNALRDRLKARLALEVPDYMVPAQWMFLAQMPLSPNGKLERRALPKPDAQAQQREYLAPRSELEARLVSVWEDVLKRERIGVSDNFFELGGDSIISIQVVSRARQAGIRFTPKELFQHQTVQSLASVARLGEQAPAGEQGPARGQALLLPFQQVFFEMDLARPQHWNQSVLLQPSSVLQGALLEQALQALVGHHDALRLSFSQVDGQWRADFAERQGQALLWQAELNHIDELEALGNQAQASLDLAAGPLLRAVLAQVPDGGQRLLLVIHHLAVDGVSWRILFEDLQSAYNQLAQGQAVSLPAKTSSVQAWAARLQAHAAQLRDSQLEFWRDQLADASPLLPCDNPDGGLSNRHARTVNSQLDKALTRQLLQVAPAAYRTQINDLLLTALARVIARWSGQPSVLVQLEGHGREDLFDDIDLTRTVGWFTSLYPVRLTPAASLEGSIKQVKEQLRAIPDKGLGFGVLRYLGEPAVRDALAALPVPRITFNYLGQFDASFTEDDGLFAPSGEAAGADQDADAPLGNWLSLNGQVFDGELTLGWTFSHEMFDSATIERLAAEYSAELAALVEHCCEDGQRGLTPSDFPLARLTQAQLDALALDAAEVADLYPLSPMQQGMLFHTLYEQNAGDYINQMRLGVEGLDPQRFEQAWQAAVDAQDILRSGFLWQGAIEQPLQVVYKQARMPFSVHDWRGRDDQAEALAALAEAERLAGFDLARAPLLRLQVVQVAEQRFELIYTHHHILMDGWSNSQLLGEVMQRYAGIEPERGAGRYQDYIAWLQAQDAQASETFWKGQLQDLDEPTRLAESQSGSVRGSGYGDTRQAFDAALTARLGTFARQQKVTLNTLLQAAWLLLLQRYTGQACVTFGATVSGRPAALAGIEQQIGLFINTLPVIASPQAQQSVGDWLQAVQARNLALREQEHTPLAQVQRWAGTGGEALFDSIMVFENYPVSEALEQEAPQELRFGAVASQEQTHYPLTLVIAAGDQLNVQYSYARSHFDEAAIARIGEHWRNLLLAMLDQAQRPCAELDMLGEAQRLAQFAEWNAEARDFPAQACLHQLIETQAARVPDATAVVFQDQRLSYDELNSQANQLAHYLIAQGVGPEVRVGLAVERGLPMVVAIVAILKAGGAYVPLDPIYPQERLGFMVEDSGIAVLLTQASLQGRFPGVPALLLDTPLDGYPQHNPEQNVVPGNLAYIIYTSGSTGKPKGALLAHHNVVRLFEATESWFGFDQTDVWSLFHSYAFDFSVWEIFGALLYGGKLVVVPQDVARSPEDFL